MPSLNERHANKSYALATARSHHPHKTATMVFSVAAATARRRIAVMATRQATQGQKRNMGGPPPEWEGIDKVVRDVFPADYQRKFRGAQASTQQPCLNFSPFCAQNHRVMRGETVSACCCSCCCCRFLSCFTDVDAQLLSLS